MQQLFEQSVLSGWSNDLQASPPAYDPRPHGEKFAAHLEDFRKRYLGVTDFDLRERLVRATSILDVWDEVNAVLRENRIDGEELMARTRGMGQVYARRSSTSSGDRRAGR